MTGKEFFGKLLSNREQTPEPWDPEDTGNGLAPAELEDVPTFDEEIESADDPGGDGQSSALPDVRPSTPHSSEPDTYAETPDSSDLDTYAEIPYSSDTDAHVEIPDSYFADEPPVHPLNSTEDLDIPEVAPVHDASHASDYSSADADVLVLHEREDTAVEDPAATRSNGSPSDHELSEAPPSSNGSPSDHELPVAPSPSNGAPAELPAAPASSTPTPADMELPEAPTVTNGRDSDHDHAARPNTNGMDAAHDHPAPPYSNGRDSAPPSSNGRHAEVNAVPPSSNGHHAEVNAAPPSRNGHHAEVNAAPPSSNGHHAEVKAAPPPSNGRRAEVNAAPPPEKTRPAAPPPVDPGAVAPAAKPPAEKTRNRTDAPAQSRPDRKDSESSKGRSKAPASADVELRGIKDRVVIRLLDKKLVSEAHVKAALRERNKDNLKATLWRIVAHQRGVDREAIYREAALTYAFVERKLEEKDVDLEFVRQVADVFPEKRRNRLIELRVVPVGYEFEQQTQMLRVVFLTHDPSLPAVRELMQELNLERYELQYAPELVVKDLLGKAFPRKNEYLERMSEDPLAYDLGLSYEEERGELIDEEALEAEINRSSLINLFEAALVESVHKGASDIHIYPNAKRQVEIHFRVDGRLLLWHLEDKVHPESLLAVIKDNTMNVDRFERDMAQDGFIQRKVDDTLIRYRVSILPIATAQQSLHAESIVIRVLDDRKVITDLAQLGLLKGALERFDMAIRQPHGMVILTGPTGSGKSTTLVAALHQVVNPEINVLTVEDPVEYIIPGVRQIKLNHKLNLEQALRSILRHDPDVVMVGEMRDRPTAELAIKLANTGHLTFSTLHTNDAPSAVSRLYKMGVEPFLIAYAINLVVAQRLIRAVCPTCKVVDGDPDPVLLDRLGFTKDDLAATTLYKASGDPTCKTCKGIGYKGRRAISEALYFSRAIRHMVVEADTKIDEDALREAARKEGMLTLQDSAREVVKMGLTSVDEMMRVTATEE